MTKSRTLRKAGAVVLSLAMAFSVAGVAPSADAAAKKPALSAKKGTITVGKKKTVKVKNTTAKKVKKLVVSSNKKAVATVKKKSKVKFTVTGKKAGTAKITAKVTLKKAVAKKKVYTLKYTATVKKAATPTTAPEATATPGELKLEKVEAGTQTGNNTNILIAYFSTTIDSLDPSEVQIREVSTDALYSVEKVVLAADKKSAVITLTGTTSAGTGVSTTFLRDNVDYKMIVTKNGKTLEKVFSIPAVEANARVYATNAAKKQILINQINLTTGAVAGNLTLTVPDDITVDYEEILGDNVTVFYNKDLKITKLVDETKSVYGAFSASTDGTTITYTDIVTGTKYSAQNAAINASTITSVRREKGADNATAALALSTVNGVAATTTTPTRIEYAKLVLNSNGTIRTVVSEDAWSAYVLADSVNNTSVVSGKGELNLNGYTIVKDGKTIKVSDIQKDDVVFYNSGDKFAEVFTSKTTGKLEGTFDGGFTYGGKKYKIDKAYYQGTNGAVKVDDAYMNALLKEGKDITVFVNRAGEAVFIAGTTAAAAAPNTNTYVITDATKTYNQSLVNYIRLTAYDTTAKAEKTIDIDVSKLTKIVDKDGHVYEMGKAIPAADVNANNPAGNTVAEFVWYGAGTLGTLAAYDTAANVNDTNKKAVFDSTTVCLGVRTQSPAGTKTTYANAIAVTTLMDTNVQTELAKGDFITLTADATSGAITGIDLTHGAAKTMDLKKGLTSFENAQIKATCPIYSFKASTTGKYTITASTLDDLQGTIGAADNVNVTVYKDAKGQNVTAIVVDGDKVTVADSQTTTKEVIVSSSTRKAGVVSELIAWGVKDDGTVGQLETFTAFKSDVKNDLKCGEIVQLTIGSDKKTVQSITADNGVSGSVVPTEVNLGATSFGFVISAAETTLGVVGGDANKIPIVEIKTATDGTQSISASSFNNLATLKPNNTVKVSYNGTDTSTVDAIVIVKNDQSDTNLATARTAMVSGLKVVRYGTLNGTTGGTVYTGAGTAETGSVDLGALTIADGLNTAAKYALASARIAYIDKCIKAYTDLGGKIKTLSGTETDAGAIYSEANTDYVAYKTAKDNLKTTGETLIVDVPLFDLGVEDISEGTVSTAWSATTLPTAGKTAAAVAGSINAKVGKNMTVKCALANGSKVDIKIASWADTDTYDPTSAATYGFTATPTLTVGTTTYVLETGKDWKIASIKVQA